MPKHKQSSSSDSDSGPEDRNPPAKKHAPAKSSAPKPDEHGWHIGNNRFANVREFKGKIMVDIREYYEKDGELKPGKKGIALSAKQWKSLRDLVEDIDQKLTEMA